MRSGSCTGSTMTENRIASVVVAPATTPPMTIGDGR